MNRVIKISFLPAVFILLFTGSALSSDKYYLLTKSNIAIAEGRTEEAILYIQDYIESHPTTTGSQYASYHRKKQYYIRNLLMAYSNLFDILRENGQTEEIDIWLEKLKNAYLNDIFKAKNLYTLGRIYAENNLFGDAVDIFEQVIREQEGNYYAYNIKAMLRACSKLFKIYQSRQETDKTALLLATLQSNYPNADFDLNDEYKLATLFLNYGEETNGEHLLKAIIVEQGLDSNVSNSSAMINTYSKLLTIYHKRKDIDQLERLIGQISGIENLSPGNMYKLAVTCLKCDEAAQGSKILMNITDQYSSTTYGRKALFLLGRESQSREDWDSAIKYFAGYVNKYPSHSFFALKAYSRLLDCYWARDADMNFVKDEAKKLADIVNGISDFETQLNLARDLKWKGFDELASATFSLGLSSARKFISKNKNTYAALRTHWLIEKYAVVLDMPDVAETSAKRILEITEKQKSDLPNAEKNENIEYIKSQTYLWLARIFRNRQDFQKSKKFLKIFIRDYPDDKEIPYARYELGRIYEDEMRVDEAVKEYRMIEGDDMWEEKAVKAISRCID